MKKGALAAILVSSVLFALLIAAPEYEKTEQATGTLTPEQQTQQSEPLYYVRVYEGRLAVYRDTETDPFAVTDIRLSSLREYDQQLMQQGFPLYSEQELTTFLEDYGS